MFNAYMVCPFYKKESKMKRNKLLATCNLIAVLLIVAVFIFACTYEVHAFEKYAEKKQEQGQQFVGLGALGLVIFLIYGGIFYAVAFLLLTISWIGLFKSDKIGFLIVGSIGKVLAIGGFFFLFIATVSIFSKVFYCLLGLAYLASGVLDILYRKKIL